MLIRNLNFRRLNGLRDWNNTIYRDSRFDLESLIIKESLL